jgi:hypothetical protein
MQWSMQYKLPAGIACDAGCVLQFKWFAMQTCIEPGCDRTYCGTYADGVNMVYGNRPGFCGATSAPPEYFANCADIRIIPSGAPISSPSPAPLPSSPSPSPAPSSPSPAGSCPPGPSSARAACMCQGVTVYKYYADVEQGCAGASWCYGPGQSAYVSCSAGLVFNEASQLCDWPANVQCQAAASPSPAVSPSPSPAVSPSPSPSPAVSPSPSPSPAVSPSPSPSPVDKDPCPAAPGAERAACFCRSVTEYKYYADTANGCTGAMWCYGAGQSTYTTCAAGLLFSQAGQVCDWAANVQCAASTPASPSPAVSSPSPSPSPSTSPSPSPSTSPSPSSPAPGGPAVGKLPSGPLNVAYYQTWSAPWAGKGAALDLAKIPGEQCGACHQLVSSQNSCCTPACIW